MVKTASKQIKQAYRQYEKSNNYNLYDAYGRFSRDKAEAFDYCKSVMSEHNGSNLKIISFNTYQFSAGFVCDIDGVKSFVYITKSIDRFCNIDKLN